jgi:addiction module RelB/DinJ family antitoxin
MSIQISTSLDETTQKQFNQICKKIGISPSNALNILVMGVISSDGIPFTSLTSEKPPQKMPRASVFGCMRGQFKMADDFDAPLDDFKEYME